MNVRPCFTHLIQSIAPQVVRSKQQPLGRAAIATTTTTTTTMIPNTVASSSTGTGRALSQQGFTLINIKKNIKTEPNGEQPLNKKIKCEPYSASVSSTPAASSSTSTSSSSQSLISSSPPMPPAPPASPVFDSNSQRDSSQTSMEHSSPPPPPPPPLSSSSFKDSNFFFSVPTHSSARFDKEDIRKMWSAEHHCDDGHYVRSLGELLIDNWLYHHRYLYTPQRSYICNRNSQFFYHYQGCSCIRDFCKAST